MVVLAGAVAPSPAPAARMNCGPRTDLLKDLAQQYREAPVAVGVTNTGAVVEVLTSNDGSTWTILLSQPSGSSCVVASGELWQELKRIGELQI